MKLFQNLIPFLLIFLFSACNKANTLFKQVEASHSGIEFNNEIQQTDSINVLDFENVYNGGGVGVGDFNGDGLEDLYFTGNLVQNRLYINQGKLKFIDATDKAGVSGNGRWCRGATVVDINNDGKLDIYVSATIKRNPEDRRNLLYINTGNDDKGIPKFQESAAQYGLSDTTQSTMAAFFDYDNDGDLDMYLAVNHIIRADYPNRFRPKIENGTHPSTGRLYRNDWNGTLGHPYFTDVSKQAGILTEGYSHNVSISDFNRDGWKDIFVTNDYLSNDVLYINNRNGTFSNKAADYFKHTAANAMGSDVNDINNDGLLDVIELDMNPEDNYRKKMMLNANSYQTYQNSDYFNYQYQYVRNILQLNMGPRMIGDSLTAPVFSDIAFFAGMAETDWSWTPLVTDFDNDGFRDVIITNGFPRDVTDHDFVAFRNKAFSVATKTYLLEQIPEVKIHNYAFRNNGALQFEDKTGAWGFEKVSFTNGAAYADLDNDGDLDVIMNNINDPAFLYENTTNNGDSKKNWLQVKLNGDSLNRQGIGAWIEIYYGGHMQVYEQNPYRGYLSSIPTVAHFGLDTFSVVDSLIVKWPLGKISVLRNVKPNQTIAVSINAAQQLFQNPMPLEANIFFKELDSTILTYRHQEKDFIDFNIQKLIPHKFSEYGPALAGGDVNGDGRDDIVIGGSYGYGTALCLQQPDGHFTTKNVTQAHTGPKNWEDMGVCLFDADGDGDLDLYTASGGYENPRLSDAYADKFYVNDGKANFRLFQKAIPQNKVSKSCVRAADYDNDGDLDLFIAGRVDPSNYPLPVSSFIYRNDSKKDSIRFTDVTASVAPGLQNAGLTCDGIWTDFNNDGWTDLITVGEWMPISFFQNEHGILKNITASTGLANKRGWWTSIAAGDFDNDGDIDYIAGNLGENSYYRAKPAEHVRIYAKDFDKNGSLDAVPTLYLRTSQQDTTRKEYPAHTRDDMVKQLISFRSKFQNYKSYADAGFDKMFTADEMKDALVLEANYFSNSYIRNDGNGKFTLMRLPSFTQFSCMNGMLAEDINSDGNLDIVAVGNDYGTEVSVGRYDACNGIFLKGNGKGSFTPQTILQSGWFVPGNAKALVKLNGADGKTLIVASQNKDALKAFVWKGNNTRAIPANKDDVAAIVTYADGKKQRRELYYGASFLSQSGRFLSVDKNVRSVEMINSKGERRNISL